MARPINPLLREFVHGTLARGAAQRNYLLHLLFQSTVLFVWWPKDSLADALTAAQAPATLVAVCAAAGVSLSYYAMRAGAEELRLGEQQSLREWTLSTPLPITRIVSGYLTGVGLHLAFLLLLCSPLVLAASALGGGSPAKLIALTAMIWTQGAFFWLLAAVIYLAIGHRGMLTYFSVRALLVGIVLGTVTMAPTFSILSVSRVLVKDAPPVAGTGVSIGPHEIFLLGYGTGTAVLAALLLWLLMRSRAGVRTVEPGGSPP